MKLTPELYAKGFFEFSLPWVAKQGITYECLAIRSFEDIYKLGIDVYTKYYVPVGLKNGQPMGATVFDFDKESKLYPNIVTLKGADGSMLYIPDTFITKIPDKSLVPYSEVVFAISLGLLPDEEDLSGLQSEVAELIAARANIEATVNICRVSTLVNPTVEEHRLLEALRLGTPPQVRPNTMILLEQAQEQLKDRDLKIALLTKLIKEKGLTNDL